MNQAEKDEYLELFHDVPPRLKNDRKEIIRSAFGTKSLKKRFGSPDKILKIFSILEANGFGCFKASYVATKSSKFNPPCQSNAERTQFNKVDGEFSIISVSDIKQGEEITISYNWSELSMKNRKMRQEFIRDRFQFNCSCQFCKEEE